MKTFEYYVIYLPEGCNQLKKLNEAGDQGWELVSVDRFNAYLKREKIKAENIEKEKLFLINPEKQLIITSPMTARDVS